MFDFQTCNNVRKSVNFILSPPLDVTFYQQMVSICHPQPLKTYLPVKKTPGMISETRPFALVSEGISKVVGVAVKKKGTFLSNR